MTYTARAIAEGGLHAEASASINLHQPVFQITKTGPQWQFIDREAKSVIELRNVGDAVARQMHPTFMSHVPCICADKATASAFCTVPVSAAARWKVVVKAIKPGDTRFKATLEAAELQRPVYHTESTHFYTTGGP